MRFHKLLFVFIFFAAMGAPALAEYFTGVESAYFHSSAECELSADLPIGRAAADEFGKLPCPDCVINISIKSAHRGGIAAVRISAGIDNAVFSSENQYAYCVGGEWTYLLLPGADKLDLILTTPGGAQPVSAKIKPVAIPFDDAVIDFKGDSYRFAAFDFAGARVCSLIYSADAEIHALEPIAIETGGEHIEIVEYVNDENCALNWIMTRADYDDMRANGGFNVMYARGGFMHISPFFAPMWTGDFPPEGGWAFGAYTERLDTGADIDAARAQRDFCGAYLSASGAYAVVVKNPHAARAHEYADICGGDIWIIEGEYTREQLESAMSRAIDIAGENFLAASVTDYENCVSLDVRGVDCERLLDAELPDCVRVFYGARPLDDFDATLAHDHYKTPVNGGVFGGCEVSMELSEYPVAPSYLSFSVDAPADVAEVEIDGSLYKWDGEFKLVKGDFGGERALIGTGKTNFKLDLTRVDALGPGLYRLCAGKVNGERADVEFVVTDVARALDDYEKIEPEIFVDIAAHAAPSDEDDYDSRAEPEVLKVGGYELEVRFTGGDAVENSYIVARKPGESAAHIYAGPFEGLIWGLRDAGDALIFIADSINSVCTLEYGANKYEILSRSKVGPAVDIVFAKKITYVSTGAAIYRITRSGAAQRLWAPESGVAEMEFYEGALHAVSVAGIKVTLR